MRYRFRNWRNDADAIAAASRGMEIPRFSAILVAMSRRCGEEIAVAAAKAAAEKYRFEQSLARSGLGLSQAVISRLGEKYCRLAMPRRQYNSMALYNRVIDVLAAM